MGESFSRYLTKNVVDVISRKRKRRNDDGDSDDECSQFLEKTMHTPKRKKLVRTSQYIFQALFKEGNGSDVTVIILNKPWKLHRVYLSQSPYFLSMFSGSWKEAQEDTINIEVIDPNINLDSLYIVLGSLYLDEITLEPADVISTLATASLFQLDGIIEQCVEIMAETVNFQTVIGYHNTASVYCLAGVKDATFKWLLVNLLSFMHEKPEKLVEIGVSMMISLISSPDLFVMQIEFYVYTMLRYWMFLQLDTGSSSLESCSQYFSQRQGSEEFLLTKKGATFAPVFRHLRLHNLINHHMDLEMLKHDRIVPWCWLAPFGLQQWSQMLRLDSGIDAGPRVLGDDEFTSKCVRCGRMLKSEGENVWRWTGFNFGLDLVWTVGSGSLRVRRNHRQENACDVMLSQQHRRHVILRVTVLSLDEQRQVRHSQTTGIRALAFARNQETVLLELDSELKYPLHISVNLLVASPITAENAPAASTTKQTTLLST